MIENIHRQTFEEILNLDVKNYADCERVSWTSFIKSFKNIGKMFQHSFMFEKTLPPDAQERQQYAESVAKRYGCKVSYRAIYSTKGRIDELWKVREELIKMMYVSPIFWSPLKTGERCHFKTFAFGFFPYADVCDDKDELYKIIAKRIDMINDGENPSKITFDKDDWHDKKEQPRYILYPIDDKRKIIDISTYNKDMSSREYFYSIVYDCDAALFLLPKYKMMFVRTNEEYDMYGPKYEDDYQKLIKIHDILSEHIAVSDIIELSYDGKWCYGFGYDDTRYDTVLQHLGFFDTWENFD